MKLRKPGSLNTEFEARATIVVISISAVLLFGLSVCYIVESLK